MLDALARRRRRLLGLLARGDVAPRADHLDGLALLVADQALLVVDPAIAAVLLEEAVLDGVAAVLEQLAGLRPRPRRDRPGCTRLRQKSGLSRYSLRLVAEPVA